MRLLNYQKYQKSLLKQILNYPNFTDSKTQLSAADEEQTNNVNGEFSTLPWLKTRK